jgi:hypothetical protein
VQKGFSSRVHWKKWYCESPSPGYVDFNIRFCKGDNGTGVRAMNEAKLAKDSTIDMEPNKITRYLQKSAFQRINLPPRNT